MPGGNNAKRVLLITYYWPPSGGAGVQRFVKFARHLPQFGVNPVILTVANPSYPVLDPEMESEIPDDLPVYKSHALEPLQWYAKLSGKSLKNSAAPVTELSGGSTFTSRLAGWIRANFFIPDARLGWVPWAVIRAHELMQRFNCQTVVTTGTPHSSHLIGLYLKTRLRYRWIADFRDPWVDIHYNQLLPRSTLAVYLDRKLESTVWKNADERVVVSPGMKRLFAERYPEPAKIITNGFDPRDFTDQPETTTTDQVLTIRHVGTLPESSIPDLFLRELSEFRNYNFKIEWVGSVHDNVTRLTAQLGLNNRSRFPGYVGRNEAIGKMQTADLLLLIIPRVRHADGILTGKLFNYLGSGRPILMLGPTEGDAAHIIQETGSGWCFDHTDYSGIRNFLGKLLDDSQILNTVSPDQQKIEAYSRVNQARELSGLI